MGPVQLFVRSASVFDPAGRPWTEAPRAPRAVWGGGAAAIVVLMLLKAWRIMDVPAGGFGIGFFLGVIAAAAIAYGGYMMYAEEKARAG